MTSKSNDIERVERLAKLGLFELAFSSQEVTRATGLAKDLLDDFGGSHDLDSFLQVFGDGNRSRVQAFLLQAQQAEVPDAPLVLKVDGPTPRAYQLYVEPRNAQDASDVVSGVVQELPPVLAGRVELDSTLHRIALSLVTEHDEQALLQRITDEATAMCRAEFGAFFFNSEREDGKKFFLYTLSGAPREAFASFPMPRATLMVGLAAHAAVALDNSRLYQRYEDWARRRFMWQYGVSQSRSPCRRHFGRPALERVSRHRVGARPSRVLVDTRRVFQRRSPRHACGLSQRGGTSE